MEEWYTQGKIPCSSTRPHWQSYQQSNLEAKQEDPEKEIYLTLLSILVHISKGSLTCRKILQHGTDGFISPPKEALLQSFIALKNPLYSTRVEAANPGSNDKHASRYTTEDDRSV
jgi:hypothetical protein